MESRRLALVAAVALALACGAAVWLLNGHAARSAIPEARPRVAQSTEPPAEAVQLEDVGEPSQLRSLGKPIPDQKLSPSISNTSAWRLEMKNSPLRAKMREYAHVEEWEKKYSPLDVAGLLKEQDVVDKQIVDMIKDEMQRRLDRGMYEIVSTDGTYSGPHYNTCEVYWVTCDDGKTYKRVLLPEKGFEDVYRLKALSTWLYEFAHERDVQLTQR
jgi:hypothetical protein